MHRIINNASRRYKERILGDTYGGGASMQRVERTIRFKLYKECHVCGDLINKGLRLGRTEICNRCERNMVEESNHYLYDRYIQAVKEIWKHY